MRRFQIFDFKNAATLKTRLGVLKVVRNIIMRYRSYDFLLTFYSNYDSIHGILSQKKFNFSTPVYFAPLQTGFSMELGIGASAMKNRNDWAIRWSKKFQDRFSCLDTILACDIQPRYHSNNRAMLCVARA